MQDLANKIVKQGEQIVHLNTRVTELTAALSANTKTLQLLTNAGETEQAIVQTIGNDGNSDDGPVIPWVEVCKVLRGSKMRFFLYNWYDLRFEKIYAALKSQKNINKKQTSNNFCPWQISWPLHSTSCSWAASQ